MQFNGAAGGAGLWSATEVTNAASPVTVDAVDRSPVYFQQDIHGVGQLDVEMPLVSIDAITPVCTTTGSPAVNRLHIKAADDAEGTSYEGDLS